MSFKYNDRVWFIDTIGRTSEGIFLSPHPNDPDYSVVLCNDHPKTVKTSRLKDLPTKVKRWMTVYRCGSIGIHGRDPKKWLSVSIKSGEVIAIKEIEIEYFEGEGLDEV